MSKELVCLSDIHMDYGGREILKSIDLPVRDGEFLTLLGPSGCGKTTTLRIIGGFESPTSGVVYFDGKKINDVPPYRRPINTVFQRYALFTHLDVYGNIAFGLRLKKVPQKQIDARVSEMLELVNLKGYEDRRVFSLSGGEQQRVAIARALVNQPRLLLLDEPLGALDLKLRKEMQIELKRIQTTLGITFIYVTHDQEEALTMSDTIVVMNRGTIQQIGSPTDIYNEPSNAFVADFIGESNIVDGIMIRDRLVEFAGRRFECVDGGFMENERIQAVIRPEDLKISPPEKSQLTATIRSTVFKGVHYEMVADLGGFSWLIHSTISESVGNTVGLGISPHDIHIMKKAVTE